MGGRSLLEIRTVTHDIFLLSPECIIMIEMSWVMTVVLVIDTKTSTRRKQYSIVFVRCVVFT